MGCQDKIEDQESLNVFIQSLFSDADRLNVSKILLKCSLNYFLDETIKTIVSNSYTNGYSITSVKI